MERIKNLDRYQKGILLVLAAMALVFAGIYAAVTSHIGYEYNDQILEPGIENGNAVYTATVQGEEWCFTVTPDKTVTFRCGETMYGPYTAKEDPAAIPADHTVRDSMTGLEVREGDNIIFRGGIVAFGGEDSHWLMIDEEGTVANFISYAVMSDGTMVGGEGEIIDPRKPSVSTVLQLMIGPELSHKGDWYGWIACVFLSIITAITILYADELFRLKFVFRVQNVEKLEPSDWEVASRYIGWTLLTILVFAVYMKGLQ